MTDLTRRSLLAFAPIAGVSLAVRALPVAAEPGPLMVEWDSLSRETQAMVFVDYWRALTLEAKRTACQRLREQGLGGIADQLMPEFSGAGLYEFRVLDEDGNATISPVAYLDHAPGRPGWFRWRHYHQGKFQGLGHLLPAHRVEIRKKMEALG